MTNRKTKKLPRFQITHRDWPLIPLGLMVITCLYIFLVNIQTLLYLFSPSFYGAFWFPALPSLLIALFGVLYIYKTLTRKRITKSAKAISYILLIIFFTFLLFVATIPGGKGHICTGLFGVQTDCSSTNALTLYILFANPYSLMLLSTIAIVGIFTLLTPISLKNSA
jgi:hypothetical protein